VNTRARGFTLVESLIALLLLSVGLLGAGGLLLGGLQSHAEALRHMTAMNLVRDLADRIRANPRARMAYDTRGAAVDAQACEPALPCEPAQRASSDLAHFIFGARRLFPGGETIALVEFEPAIGPAAPERYAITLRWRGPRDPVNSSTAVTLHLLAQPVAG
jgi:type IV pilus assembly protein PilV